MKKRILVAAALLTAGVTFAQKKLKQPPPPPPPKIVDVKEVPPPPPPPKPPIIKDEVEQVLSPVNADYQRFLEQNPTIKRIGWSNKNIVHIHLKSGKMETYDLNKTADAQKLKDQYGELPVPPPPPPPPLPKAPKQISES